MTDAGDLGVSIPHDPAILTAKMVDSLRRTRGWVRLLAILGFCMCGLLVLLAAGVLLLGSFSDDIVPFEAGFIAFLYVFFAFVYAVPSLYLFQYGGAIGKIRDDGDRVRRVEEALELQRAFWKFMGVLAILMVVLWLVAMTVAVIAAMMSGGTWQ